MENKESNKASDAESSDGFVDLITEMVEEEAGGYEDMIKNLPSISKSDWEKAVKFLDE